MSDICSRADLARCIEQFQKTDMFFGTDFPNDATKDFQTVCDKFVRHATGNHLEKELYCSFPDQH